VVDTGSYLSPFGQVVILLLVQLGGLGFMTMTSLIVLALSRRLGLRRTLAAQTERRSLSLGDVRSVLRGIVVVTLTIEAGVGLVLALRLTTAYDYPVGKALWHGLFHAVSAFNNAGFGLHRDSLVPFADDPLVLVPVIVAIVIGGLGFPVMVDLFRRLRTPAPLRRHGHLTLHSRLTLATSAVLFGAGLVAVLLFEWRNPSTLGSMPWHEKGLAGLFTSVTPRTAGFDVIDTGGMTDEGLLATIVLMFIGAGSAGTSGGIKVSTFAVIGLVIIAELRGHADVDAFRRRIPQAVQRQATTVAALSIGVVVVTAMVLLVTTEFPLSQSVFEATSAFGTVGLSTGITSALPTTAQLAVTATMLVGRVGPATLGAALIVRHRPIPFRYPEEGPIIG
jgi:Trk-type K+ transport system membrane component